MIRNVIAGLLFAGSISVTATVGQIGPPSGNAAPYGGVADLRDSSVNAFTNSGTVQTCATVPVGLVSAFSGDGNALDARSRNNGTIQNNVTYATGQVGQAFHLGGVGNGSNSGDRVIIGNPPNLRLQNFTFEVWIKRSSSTILTNSPFSGFPNGTIYAFGGSGPAILIDHPTNRLAFSQANINQINSNLTITDTNWHHIAISVSGSQVVFYLDGVADTPIAYTSTFAFTANAAIGARGDSEVRNAFFGAIDELAIYNRVLSASEIQAIVNAGTSGKCKPLATVAPENQVLWIAGDGDFRDSSGNGLDATPAVGASSPKLSVNKVGQGFVTNGGPQYATIPDSTILRPQSFTIEGWANPTDSVGTKVFFGKPFGNLSSNSYALFQQNANIGGAVCDNATCLLIFAPISNNVWHHIAFSFDDPGGAATKTARLYLDGVLVASNTTAIVPFFDTRPAIIGADINNGTFSEGWIGGLDEISFYNRGLTAVEIESIANAGLAGKYKVQSTVPTGLVAWFAGDSNPNDISGNGNNATLAGGVNAPTFTTAFVGQGFNHSGLQYATVPDSAAFRPPSLTIEGWVRSNSTSTQAVFSKTLGAGTFDSYGVFYNGNINGVVCNGTGCLTIATPMTLNVWHHVAFSYDDPGGVATKTARLYLDGVLVASGTGGAIGYDTRPVVIGADIESGSFQLGWNGNIDEVAFYNRALSATEIRDHFYAGSGGKYKGEQNPTVSNKTKTGEATVTFGTITTPGAVHLTPLNPALFPAVPIGINTGLNFDVSTNAVYTNPTVCFNGSAFTPAQFGTLRVFHLESGSWQDRTDNSSVYPNLCSSGLTSLSPFAIGFAGPTAANVSIGGRVTTMNGNGIRNAVLRITEANGTVHTTKTTSFGYYNFPEIEAGQSVVIEISSKRYTFTNPTRIVSVQEDIANVDFTAEP